MKRNRIWMLLVLMLCFVMRCSMMVHAQTTETELPAKDNANDVIDTTLPETLERIGLVKSTYDQSSVTFDWIPNEEADYYQFYRQIDGSEWEECVRVDVPQSSFTDTGFVSGHKYKYGFRLFNENSCSGFAICGDFLYLDMPAITYEQTDNGVEIQWNPVEGADNYLVSVLGWNDEWEHVSRSNETSYTYSWIRYGEEYTIKVTALYDTDPYQMVGTKDAVFTVVIDQFSLPKNLKVTNTGGLALELTWDSSIGATGHVIYRSTYPDSGFEEIGRSEIGYYKDETVEVGSKYYYKIAAYGGDIVKECEEIVEGTAGLQPPVIAKTTDVTETSVRIKWEEHLDADGYYIYRKANTKKWKKIKTIKKNTTITYTDKKATSNCSYSIIAYKKVDNVTYKSAKSEEIVTGTIKQAVMKSIKQKGKMPSVTIKWSKVKGATGYQIYQKIGKGGWRYKQTVSSKKRTATFEIAVGTKYQYKVRAIVKKGGITSRGEFSNSKDYKFALPKITYETDMTYDETGKEVVTITIKNNTKKKLRFYSDGAMLLNPDYTEVDRNLKLMNQAGVDVPYVDIKGKGKVKLTYRVDGEPCRYMEDTILNFTFEYENLYYIFLTYANGVDNQVYVLK